MYYAEPAHDFETDDDDDDDDNHAATRNPNTVSDGRLARGKNTSVGRGGAPAAAVPGELRDAQRHRAAGRPTNVAVTTARRFVTVT